MANKIFLSFFLLTSLAFGADSYDFIVDSPTMVEVYWSIFNAMAAMFQSPQYLEILKLVFLVGGTFIFIIGVLKTYQGGAGTAPLGDFAKYMIVGMAMLMMLFSHPSNLIIKTNKIPSLCETTADLTRKNYLKGMISFGGSASTKGAFDSTGTVVGNIPMVLAWTFSFVNEIGRETTKLATSAFSDETKMVVFNDNSDYASYLSTISSLLSLKMPSLVSDMIAKDGTPMSLLTALDALQRDCILIPASKSENVAIASSAFSTTGDMYRTMVDLFENDTVSIYRNPTEKNPISSSAGFTYEDNLAPRNVLVTVHGETMRCGYLWNKIKPSIASLMNSDVIECSAGLDQKLNGSTISLLSGNSGLTAGSTGPQVVSMARNIGIHAALMNHFIESKNKIAPGEFSYASGKSIAEFTTSSLGTGYYMAKMLPKIQMGMRAVLYAFFPFVFIVVLLPGGFKNLMSYLQTLIWIELWMPTAAILNMFMALQSQESMRVLYDIKGLNMSNSLQIFSDATQMASVAGYLYASVPALTWLILKGSGQMLGNVTGAIAARMANNLDSRVINQDMQDLSKVKEFNNMRKNMGMELVSLAEMDATASRMKGMSEAGEYAANYENMSNLSKASYGRTEEALLRDTAKGDFLWDNNENKKSISAKEEMSLKTDQEYLKSLNVLNEDGTINKDKLNAFAKSIGIEKSISDLTAQQFQDQAEVARRVQAGIIQKQKELGQNEGVVSALKEGLKVLATEGNAEASKLIKRLDEGDDRAVSESFKLLAPYGEFGNQYNKNVSDKIAKALFAAGFGTSSKASADVAKFTSLVEGIRQSFDTATQVEIGRIEFGEVMHGLMTGEIKGQIGQKELINIAKQMKMGEKDSIERGKILSELQDPNISQENKNSNLAKLSFLMAHNGADKYLNDSQNFEIGSLVKNRVESYNSAIEGFSKKESTQKFFDDFGGIGAGFNEKVQADLFKLAQGVAKPAQVDAMYGGAARAFFSAFGDDKPTDSQIFYYYSAVSSGARDVTMITSMLSQMGKGFKKGVDITKGMIPGKKEVAENALEKLFK